MIGTANETGRVIFTAEPGERIVSVISHWGHCIIATEHRILEWKPDVDQIFVLDFVTLHAEPNQVLMQMRQHAERWP